MEGVILFADDKIHDCTHGEGETKRSSENALFDSLCKDLPVLGVNCLELAEKSIASIGSFSAIILDWEFDDEITIEDDDESVGLVKIPASKKAATMDFLEKNDFYSLIYIYSNENISESAFGERLKEKFGDMIQIEQKTNISDTAAAKEKILNDIKNWKDKNQNLQIPLLWSSTINKSTQKIFKELAEADANWIKDIFDTADADGVDATQAVIDIFQSLLTEKLIQDPDLIKSITGHIETAESVSDEKSIAKLFSRLFYSQLNENSPIMTGDICEISEDKFGIIISPECDVRTILKAEQNKFELLVFQKKDFKIHIAKIRAILDDGTLQNFKRDRYNAWEGGNQSQKERIADLRKLFNQNEPRFHILPSFPLFESLNESVVIEFSLGREMYTSAEVKGFSRKYKLNSPHIQQLRQRYISHLGRVGVPSLPESLRNFNLR